MPRCRRLTLLQVFVPIAAVCATGLAASAAMEAPPVDSPVIRVWVRPLHHDEPNHTQLRFALPEIAEADGELAIPCTVQVDAALVEPRLWLSVFGEGDASLFEGTVPLDGREGTFERTFVWPLAGVDDGVYEARMAVIHAFSQPVAWREVQLEKRTYGEVWRHLQHVREEVLNIEESLSLRSDMEPPTYAVLRTVIASDALVAADGALNEGDWPRAAALGQFSESCADSARALMTFAALTPELGAPVALPSGQALDIHEGAFYSESGPVFLFGLRDPSTNLDSLAMIERYGLNFASVEIAPDELLLETGVNKDALARLKAYLAAANASRVGVTVGLAAESAPHWLSPSGDSETNRPADHREARMIGQRQLKTLAPILKTYPCVNGISLAFQPAFHWDTEEVRQGFQKAMAHKYDDNRRTVNRAWRTRLRELSEIEILWEYDKPAYQYDWQTWHQQVVSSHFTWLATYAERMVPDIPKQIVLPGTLLDAGDARTGIDREALAGVSDVTACAAEYRFGTGAYAIPFPAPELSYRLLRSLAPEHPLMVTSAAMDFGGIPAGSYAARSVHTAMWEAAVAGVNGCAAMGDGSWKSPGGLDGFVTAYLDVNRLGKIVASLQRAESPIAILWSKPSMIYRDGEAFLESVQRAYEGCAFFGFPLRFITEEECVAGGLDEVAVLVMPEVPALADQTFQAIDAYARAGGAIVRSGRPAPYTPNGSARHEVIAQTAHTIFVRASDTPTVYLHALDAAYVFGILPAIPRTINNYGYPLEGVKSRYTEVDGEGYLYVVNLRNEAVRAHLFGGPREGRDLVQGRDVQFPMSLEPLEPMLVRFDTPSPLAEGLSPVLAANQDGQEGAGGTQGPVVLEAVAP